MKDINSFNIFDIISANDVKNTSIFKHGECYALGLMNLTTLTFDKFIYSFIDKKTTGQFSVIYNTAKTYWTYILHTVVR